MRFRLKVRFTWLIILEKRITQFEVRLKIEIFTKAFNWMANVEKANGFKIAGIFPMDPKKFQNIYHSTRFKPSHIFYRTSSIEVVSSNIPLCYGRTVTFDFPRSNQVTFLNARPTYCVSLTHIVNQPNIVE